MKKLLIVVSIAFLMILVGCAKKADEVELQNAKTLTDGLTEMMSNVNSQSSNTGHSAISHKPGFLAPPWPWSGPDTFPNIPEGTQTIYYFINVPFQDSLGPDTLQTLIVLTPDIWQHTPFDSNFVTKVDLWFWRKVHNDIWWHGYLDMSPTDSVHISGAMKWHYGQTWLNYAFTGISTDTSISKAGLITVTTSEDIKLSASFEFVDPDGAGTGWGKFQDFKFVEWMFYAVYDTSVYNGYYTLASENWKVQHYFPQQ